MQETYLPLTSFFIFFVILIISYLYLDFKKTKQISISNLGFIRQELIDEKNKKKQQRNTSDEILEMQHKTDQQFTDLKVKIINIDFTLSEIFK